MKWGQEEDGNGSSFVKQQENSSKHVNSQASNVYNK